MMKRLLFVLTSALLAFFFTTSMAQAATTTTINPSAAPTGTHLQRGTIGCSVSSSTGLVTCPSYELAGVGNANAQADLVASYSAIVDCRNHGGQVVEVKSQAKSAPTSTGQLEPKNGRLVVPALSSGPVPTAAQFEALATCPNGNWTKELLGGTITLSSFTYTLHFVGFTGDYITITGP
jgi:hypothetical protein